jgi:hypothetical protein
LRIGALQPAQSTAAASENARARFMRTRMVKTMRGNVACAPAIPDIGTPAELEISVSITDAIGP